MPSSIGEMCLFTSGKELLRRSLREVLSTPAVFDRTCRRAYMATLQGTVKAIQFDEISRSLEDSWTGLAGGPILATPAVLSNTGALVVANVHGFVRCFSREGIGMHSSQAYSRTPCTSAANAFSATQAGYLLSREQISIP